MFCGKCGTQNTDDAQFCAKCGAKLKQSAPTKTTAVSAPSQNNKNRKVGMIAVVAVLIIVAVVFLFGGRSYKATIKKLVNACYDADAETLFDLMPIEMMEHSLKERGYRSSEIEDQIDDLIDDTEDAIQESLDYIDDDFGEDWKITYKILDEEDIKGSKLEDIQDEYEDADVKVSAAKKIDLKIIVTADKKKEKEDRSLKVYLVKIGRSWYVDVTNMSGFF